MFAYNGNKQNSGKRTASSISMSHLGEPRWTYWHAVKVIAPLLLLVLLTLISPACAELELLTGGSGGGPGVPPSGSLSVSFIDVGQGDGVLVQAGGESYLIDAGRPEEGPNVVDFLRSRGWSRWTASWLRIPEVQRTARLGFRALLSEDGIERLELTRA